MEKSKKILTGMITLFVLAYGLFSVNINLNRQIYASVVGETSSTNNKKVWNLDRMQQVLDNPCKYKIKDINNKEDASCVPKIRVLFNANPFDFRIDMNNYLFFINNEAIPKVQTKEFFYNLKKETLGLRELIKDKLGIIYNMG
ncbi:hypothetical protein [Clostridium sp. ZS2-4]|uniref:hypothetical protein n=1 Tax=Clostridium sp. ZS2-4 TaxID=2987703 RepID=UPI00227A5A10|nr:hypothetical protein [Clostridium sp. ZS2-4]MCY6354845.1 hypothetical protein [Clostridium sp. ZS2-4]